MRIENLNGGAITSISLPGFDEALIIGAELPDTVPIDKVRQGLEEFYNGRLTLVGDEPVAEPAPVAQPTTSRRSRRR